MKMQKEIILYIVCSILLVLLTVNAQAMISISNPNDIYNLGDNIEVKTDFSYSEQVQGFLRITLECNGKETLMYFSPTTLDTSTKSIDLSFPVSEALGSCNIRVVLENNKNNKLEERPSNKFSLTDKINIDASLNKYEFEPSENLKIEGNAVKANGEQINGNIEIVFDDGSYSTEISNGKFSHIIKLPEDIAPGPHTITLKTSDAQGNKGENAIEFKIKQIPTNLEVEVNKESFVPEEILIINPKLFDQAGQIMADNVNIKLSSKENVLFIPKESILLEEYVKSGNETIYRFTQDAAPGEYFIEASFADLKVEKIISVSEFEKIDLDLENNTLIVTNIGNVPYKKSIDVNFIIENQTNTKTIDLDLEVGEIKTYKLEAPKGTYDLDIGAGNDSREFSNVPLTGNVIASIDLGQKKNLMSIWPLWLFILIIILLLLFLYLRKTKIRYKKEKKKPEKINTRKIEKEYRILKSNINIDKDIKNIFNKNSSKLAAQTIMPALVYGTKQEISVLLVSISGLEKFKELKKKDPNKFNVLLDKYFDAIIQKIKIHQGIADLYGNNLVVFFNVVKQYRHDIAAIKTAQDIRKITDAFNEAIKDLGIKLRVKAGINTGLATISSIRENKAVKYTSIGNTVSLAKALKSKAIEGEILIPESIYEKVSNVINTKKMMPLYLTDNTAINVYAVKDSKDIKSRHKWYVDKALRK